MGLKGSHSSPSEVFRELIQYPNQKQEQTNLGLGPWSLSPPQPGTHTCVFVQARGGRMLFSPDNASLHLKKKITQNTSPTSVVSMTSGYHGNWNKQALDKYRKCLWGTLPSFTYLSPQTKSLQCAGCCLKSLIRGSRTGCRQLAECLSACRVSSRSFFL